MSYSKRVDFFGYMDGNQTIAFSGRQFDVTLNRSDNFIANSLQIDPSKISDIFNFDEAYTWTAIDSDGMRVATKTNVLDTITGNIVSGTMTSMMDMPTVIDTTSGTMVSYGFYDSCQEFSDLTSQHQSYVYCTKILKTWMGDLARDNHHVNHAPFWQFALPGAHDSGMCTLDTVNQVLSGPECELLCTALMIAFPGIAIPAVLDAPIMIMNAAITQKENITAMLNIGCRYFDFRPGTMYDGIKGYDGIRYHQHAVIPGYAYVQFLQDVLSWLAQNTTEIVVVNCNVSGFASPEMIPSQSDLDEDWSAAVKNIGGTTIRPGDSSVLSTTYGDLVASNTRLIFLNQIPNSTDPTTKYDSYGGGNISLVPDPLISALESMTTACQKCYTYTVLQLQATATGVASVQVGGLFSASLTASPLMSTKALFDASTLPWVLKHANHRLRAHQPIVLLNDFIDNATVSTAIALTRQRMNITS